MLDYLISIIILLTVTITSIYIGWNILGPQKILESGFIQMLRVLIIGGGIFLGIYAFGAYWKLRDKE